MFSFFSYLFSLHTTKKKLLASIKYCNKFSCISSLAISVLSLQSLFSHFLKYKRNIHAQNREILFIREIKNKCEKTSSSENFIFSVVNMTRVKLLKFHSKSHFISGNGMYPQNCMKGTENFLVQPKSE